MSYKYSRENDNLMTYSFLGLVHFLIIASLGVLPQPDQFTFFGLGDVGTRSNNSVGIVNSLGISTAVNMRGRSNKGNARWNSPRFSTFLIGGLYIYIYIYIKRLQSSESIMCFDAPSVLYSGILRCRF